MISEESHVLKKFNQTQNDGIHLTENYSSGKKVYYVQPKDQIKLISLSLETSFKTNITGCLKNFFKEVFLPQGYPSSVSEDYTQYQIWDTAQAFCSTITGVLATQAVMTGVGVGNIEATPLAATITWVLKDGTGHIGRILFAWWKGTSLDADSKRWRLVADCLNDAAICLELALPMFYGFTTYVLCVSTAMKAVVGVAGGATRAALTQHHAIRGNLGDVSAKDGSQETAVNLIASLVAILIITYLDTMVWPLFFTFTAFHLMSNYFAVTSVCLLNFNSSRFLNAILAYVQNETFLSPKIINSQEPVLFFKSHTWTDDHACGYKIKVGHSIQKLVSSGKISLKDVKNAIEVFKDSQYLILVDSSSNTLYIVLESKSCREDILLAYFHAVLFGIILSILNDKSLVVFKHKTPNDMKKIYNLCDFLKKLHGKSKDCNVVTLGLCGDVKNFVTKEWSIFKCGIKNKGWHLENNLILSHEWRANWKNEKEGSMLTGDHSSDGVTQQT